MAGSGSRSTQQQGRSCGTPTPTHAQQPKPSKASTSGKKEYDVTKRGSAAIPEDLLDATVAAVFVEFLGLQQSTNPRAKNHAIFKIDFAQAVYGHYRGVRIDMAVDYEVMSEHSQGGTTFQPGSLLVKPVTYVNMSTSSARTFLLSPGRYAIRLRHFLGAIENVGLQHFSFVCQNDRFYGCRDFV